MVLVSQAPLKSKPSFVSVFGLPLGVELFVVLGTPPSAPAPFGPCVLLGPFPRRAGPTAPGRLAEVTQGPFPLHPGSKNRPTPPPPPCLPAPQTLPLPRISSLLTWCRLEAESCQGLVSFLWGRGAPKSGQAAGPDTSVHLLC